MDLVCICVEPGQIYILNCDKKREDLGHGGWIHDGVIFPAGNDLSGLEIHDHRICAVNVVRNILRVLIRRKVIAGVETRYFGSFGLLLLLLGRSAGSRQRTFLLGFLAGCLQSRLFFRRFAGSFEGCLLFRRFAGSFQGRFFFRCLSGRFQGGLLLSSFTGCLRSCLLLGDHAGSRQRGLFLRLISPVDPESHYTDRYKGDRDQYDRDRLPDPDLSFSPSSRLGAPAPSSCLAILVRIICHSHCAPSLSISEVFRQIFLPAFTAGAIDRSAA